MDQARTERRQQLGLAALYLTVGLLLLATAGLTGLADALRLVAAVAGLLLILGAASIVHISRSAWRGGAPAPGL